MDSELGFSLGGQPSEAEIQAQLEFFRARAANIVKQSVYIAAAFFGLVRFYLYAALSKRHFFLLLLNSCETNWLFFSSFCSWSFQVPRLKVV